jgi:hypothetical protein
MKALLSECVARMYTHEKKFQLNCWCKTSMYILFLKLLIALNASMNVTFYYSFFVGFVFPFSDWICNCTLWNCIEYFEFLYIACIYVKKIWSWDLIPDDLFHIAGGTFLR